MIKNDRQYRMTKAQIRTFHDALARVGEVALPSDVDPAFEEVQRQALQAQMDDLQLDVQEYEALKAGSITMFDAPTLADLPTMLVKARIARGLTQKDLAESLKLQEQQVQRWEANDYAGATIETLNSIADPLQV